MNSDEIISMIGRYDGDQAVSCYLDSENENENEFSDKDTGN